MSPENAGRNALLEAAYLEIMEGTVCVETVMYLGGSYANQPYERQSVSASPVALMWAMKSLPEASSISCIHSYLCLTVLINRKILIKYHIRLGKVLNKVEFIPKPEKRLMDQERVYS